MEESSNPLARGMNGLLEGKRGGLVLNILIVALVIATLLLSGACTLEVGELPSSKHDATAASSVAPRPDDG